MAKTNKPFLPTTWWGWTLVGVVGLVALAAVIVALLFLSAHITRGSLGLEVSHGNSLAKYVPDGSTVLTLPLSQKKETYVTAVTELPDDTRDTTSEDRKRKLSVKWYDGTRLISTDSPECYSCYEYRGRVVAWFPTHKWFPWLNTGAQKPGLLRSTEEQASLDNQRIALSSGSKTSQSALGLLGETSFILGPPETRISSKEVALPAGTKYVRWTMALPPLMAEAKVSIKAGTNQKIVKVTIEGASGDKDGMSVAPGVRAIKLGIVNPTTGNAVEVRSLRFYNH